MDSLFLFQFACFIFMLINAFIVALSHLHVRWENKRYERSRWMIVAALIGLAIQYVLQMTFGFRAMHDNLGAVINILLYTPCFSLISIGIYNIETTRANLRKMILMCSGIYAAIIVVFCVGINLHHSLYIRGGLYLMLTLFCVSVFYCTSNPQPIGFSGILLAKRQNSFYCTYFLHNRNVADTKSPYPIKRLEVIRWFNQKSMVFNQSLS